MTQQETMSKMPRKHRNQSHMPSIKCFLANTASQRGSLLASHLPGLVHQHRDPAGKSQEVSPHLSSFCKKHFSKGPNVFESSENPCRDEDSSTEFHTELVPQ